jgi:hypothetical protein
MALTPKQHVEVLNRIQQALQKAINKRNGSSDDSVYRVEIEGKIRQYLQDITPVLKRKTLDYDKTLRDVDEQMRVWEEALTKF